MLLPLLQNNVLEVAGASAALSGTLDGSVESDILGKTLVWTLTNDTFLAAGTGPVGSIANSQAQIDAITGSSEWNTARSGIAVTDLVRTSDTVLTLTLPALTYDITSDDTLTSPVVADVLTGGVELTAGSVTILADTAQSPSGGWAALNWYDSYRQQRQRREPPKIDDPVDREIAKYIHDDLEYENRTQEIEQLEEMVQSTFNKSQLQKAEAYNERVAKAYVRAATEGGFSAVEAFEREMDRMYEDEEFLLLAMMAMD